MNTTAPTTDGILMEIEGEFYDSYNLWEMIASNPKLHLLDHQYEDGVEGVGPIEEYENILELTIARAKLLKVFIALVRLGQLFIYLVIMTILFAKTNTYIWPALGFGLIVVIKKYLFSARISRVLSLVTDHGTSALIKISWNHRGYWHNVRSLMSVLNIGIEGLEDEYDTGTIRRFVPEHIEKTSKAILLQNIRKVKVMEANKVQNQTTTSEFDEAKLLVHRTFMLLQIFGIISQKDELRHWYHAVSI